MSSVSRVLSRLYAGSELIAIWFASLLSIYLFATFEFSGGEWGVLTMTVVSFVLVNIGIIKYYSNFEYQAKKDFLRRTKIIFFLAASACLVYFLFTSDSLLNARVSLSLLCLLLLIIANKLVAATYGKRISRPHDNTRITLVAGMGRDAQSLETQLSGAYLPGYKINGFIDLGKKDGPDGSSGLAIANAGNIDKYLSSNPVDEIMIAMPQNAAPGVEHIVSAAEHHGVRVKYLVNYKEVTEKEPEKKYVYTRFGDYVAIDVHPIPLDDSFNNALKNIFDKVFAVFALICLFPVMVVVAILIKLESAGPVFYCPTRIGKNGQPFKLFKFRSMFTNDSASSGVLSTQENDPRVTKVGKFIRKTSIDELPQFINILLGDMSVVGPRPHRSFLHQHLQETIDRYMLRQYVKPGITGWAQVNGWRGPTDTYEQKFQRTVHDLWYIDNWSIWLDIRIIFLTVFSSKVRNGAF